MSDFDWSSPDGLAAITAHLAAQIEHWRPPIAHAVALSPASSDPEWEIAHVNAPGGRHGLAAVVLASVLHHDGSTATVELAPGQLDAAIASLAPAEQCTDLAHPNLAAWRGVAAALAANPARSAVAVFIADLSDPVSSDAEGALRVRLEG